MSVSVSVVVTTRNSGQTLAACLESVRAQTVDVQLVVVDNFSADESATIGARFADIFHQAGPERSRQRNIGAGQATGSHLMFLDSDMMLQPSIVEECLRETEHGAHAAVIPEVSVGDGYWSACKALERSCYLGDETIEAPRYVEHRLFNDLRGFDEALTGEEDWDLGIRIRQSGALITRVETPLFHDEGHLTLRETMRTKYYYGRTMPRYIRKHPREARKQLNIFRQAFFRNRHQLLRKPSLMMGILMMKTCETIAGGVGALPRWP